MLSGKVLSSDLSLGLEAETLEGSNIMVTSLTPPTINGDSVIGGETADFKEVDILTCQGYLHVIDKVLFYDDAEGSDGALGKTVGLAAGAVALGAALL